MSQAIEVYSKIQDPFSAAIQIGEHFARSGMFGVDRKEAGTILALACITENRTPFEIARTYDIVDGKLRKKALACFAEFRALGGKVKWIKNGEDGIEAEAEITFEGQTQRVKFTIEDAKRQGLVREKSNWVKTPGNMLRARVVSNAIGMLAPEIVAGMADNSDDEIPAQEPKPVLKTAYTPAPAEKKATVVEVATVAEPIKTETAPEPVPVTPTPASTVEKFIAKAQPNGQLTPETVEALSNLLGDTENEALAMKWLEKKEWIKPMGDIGDLSVARAQKIFDKPDAFIKAINADNETALEDIKSRAALAKSNATIQPANP